VCYLHFVDVMQSYDEHEVNSVSNCFHNGQVIIQDDGVTITIPRGAVKRGNTVEVKVTSTPYMLPKKYILVSPFVWMGASHQSFKKPLKIEMKHCSVASEDDIMLLSPMDTCKENGLNNWIGASAQDCVIWKLRTYHTNSKWTCLESGEIALYKLLPNDFMCLLTGKVCILL